jgi:hypothetical protein
VRRARRLRRGCAQRGAAVVAAKLDTIPITYSIAICCGIALRCCACAALVFGGAHL